MRYFTSQTNPANHLGCVKHVVNNRINYQPQLLIAGFPSTVRADPIIYSTKKKRISNTRESKQHLFLLFYFISILFPFSFLIIGLVLSLIIIGIYFLWFYSYLSLHFGNSGPGGPENAPTNTNVWPKKTLPVSLGWFPCPPRAGSRRGFPKPDLLDPRCITKMIVISISSGHI